MMSKNTKIKIYYCHFYLTAKKLFSSLKSLKTLFNNADIIVITNCTNSLSQLRMALELTGVRIIHGTNRLFDFSAWYEGYKADSLHDSGTLFLNDTLFIKYPFKWILKKMAIDINNNLGNPLKAPLVISISAEYSYFLTKNPWSNSHTHLCSAFFYANCRAGEILVDLIEFSLKAFLPEDKLLENESIQSKFIDVFGEQFYAYLSVLLFSEGFWFPDKDIRISRELISLKAICYYLEHRFSGKIEELNGGFIYINRGKDNIIFRLKFFISQSLWKIKNRKQGNR